MRTNIQIGLERGNCLLGPATSPWIDLHRFWSDVTVSVLEDLEKVRERNVPNLPAISNLWDTAGRRGFDYLSSYKKYVSYGAEGRQTRSMFPSARCL